MPVPPHIPYILTRFFQQTFWLPSAPALHPNSEAPAYLPKDLSGKTYLITGGYAGVGYECSSVLYSHHGTVWIAGRSADKAASAIETLKAQHPDSKGKLLFLEVDFSDLRAIKPAVEDFLRRNERDGGGRLDWLNNNAGVMFPPPGSRSAQDHDLTFATNIYGPFLFTKLLEPILRATAQRKDTPSNTVRVSWAGSQASFLGAYDGGLAWEERELQPWEEGDGKGKVRDIAGAFSDPGSAYNASKVANWYFACEFARRDGTGDGVMHNCYNPGNLRTSLQRHTTAVMGAIAYWIIWNLICRHGPMHGAYTELYAGFGPELTVERDQGAFIVPWGRKDEMRPDMVREAEKGEKGLGGELWEWCEEVTREYQ